MKNLLKSKEKQLPKVQKKTYSNNRQKLLIGLGIIVVVILLFIGFSFKNPSSPPIPIEPTPVPSPTPDPLAPKNILILGYAGGKHEGGLLTDTMIVAHIRPKDKRVFLVSIPRDIWVNIPVKPGEDHFQKINAAFAYGSDDKQFPFKPEKFSGLNGGGNLAMNVVETVTGLISTHYIAINFQGFEKAVDILGGISVNVPVTFDDNYYPVEEKKSDPCGKTEEEIKEITATMSGLLLDQQFPCRYEHIHFDRGLQTMDGITALKFVRSRKSDTDGGDFSRSRRQQALISGIKDKFLHIGSVPKIIPLIKTASAYTSSDINVSTILDFLKNREDIIDSTISTILLTEDNVLITSRSAEGLFILIPKTGDQDWNSVHTFIQREIEKIIHPPTPMETKSGGQEISE